MEEFLSLIIVKTVGRLAKTYMVITTITQWLLQLDGCVQLVIKNGTQKTERQKMPYDKQPSHYAAAYPCGAYT